MNLELQNLRITEKEIEILSGLDVSEIFIGGVFGGVYRFSLFRHPSKVFLFCVTEILVTALTFAFTLPIGLFALRNSSSGTINDFSTIMKFLQITLGLTIVLIIGWNLYMIIKAKTLKTLMRLLDEIDNFHDLLQTVVVLERLEKVANSSTNVIKNDVLEALELIRSSLISGLMAETILRQNRRLLARRNDLLGSIENNLGTLQTLVIQQQATDYGDVLREALQISVSVHQEIQKLSR